MAKIIEVGKVCIKLAGRDAGKPVVITKVIDNNFVMIKSGMRKKGTKDRKCAIKHLEPTLHKVDPLKETDLNKVLGL